MKQRPPSSTHKKVAILLTNGESLLGYINPAILGRADSLDLLTPEGEHSPLALKDIKSVYFVREFTEPFEPERKTFLSRPKLDGLWIRLRFHDEDVIEGIVPNNLLDLLDAGVQITPPDLHGNTVRMFVPRLAIRELSVLGVVGAARRSLERPRGGRVRGTVPAVAAQSKLFGE
ncbi:MAG TPA: hypothetical protein VN661_02805 [Candidatus Acidoferrales bacterium]|nr:hypothetical protein [Candidatus Acidoferrales bacterium]